ncbi:MAG TPA: hypothetical protein VF857_10860 [Spirochaetota bacterium]
MLLSIDKVLQLFAEGKDIEKIAELAELSVSDVRTIIEEARVLLSRHEKERSRKKIIIRKKSHASEAAERTEERGDDSSDHGPSFLAGAELSAVPVEDTLVMNIAVVVENNICGVGIILHDSADRQVGKMSYTLNRITEKRALLKAVERSYEIALYFRARQLRLRTHDPIFVKQFNGDITVQDDDFKTLIDAENKKIAAGGCLFRLEAVSPLSNEKTVHTAKQAFQKGN